MRFSDLWRWDGRIGRVPYALTGLIAFVLKYSLDRFIAASAFGREWPLSGYWISPFGSVKLAFTLQENVSFIATLLAMALPFIWLGVVLTIRRLRSVGWLPELVILFFLPFLNLVFFFLLCILPAAQEEKLPENRRRWLEAVVPKGPIAAAAVAVLLVSLVSVPIVWLSTVVFEDYGWGAFVGVPFFLGLVSVMIYGYRAPQPFARCFVVSSISILFVGALPLVVGMEGLICTLMALPLGAPLAWMGGVVGYLIQRRPPKMASASQVFPLLLLAMPTMLWVEQQQLPEPPLYSVSSSIEIDAPPQTVWQSVISFPELPEPEDWVFRLGIAYPIRAEIQGEGVGAVRLCVFSTGSFVEPIEVWDEPRLLKFSVTSSPPPLEEWTPYDEINPPHLDGFFTSEGGQFRLEPLGNGGTRLVGTTWYRHSIWPTFYWRWWSDELIHRIHLRVLRHIKQQAESRGPHIVMPPQAGMLGTTSLDATAPSP